MDPLGFLRFLIVLFGETPAMPEMTFFVRWPDGEEESCYSPSLVIKRYFEPGEEVPLGEFLSRSREALTEASHRVQARYGFPCGRALGQLRRIEQLSAEYVQRSTDVVDPWVDLRIVVTRFQE